MTVSAAQALFYNQSALILSGLPNTTQYLTYPPMPKAGAVSQVKRLCVALHTLLLALLQADQPLCLGWHGLCMLVAWQADVYADATLLSRSACLSLLSLCALFPAKGLPVLRSCCLI